MYKLALQPCIDEFNIELDMNNILFQIHKKQIVYWLSNYHYSLFIQNKKLKLKLDYYNT